MNTAWIVDGLKIKKINDIIVNAKTKQSISEFTPKIFAISISLTKPKILEATVNKKTIETARI